ncbi:YadA-like family protein [Veillonella atypica]|nr:YadA-like family protein [Veillonella atypica]
MNKIFKVIWSKSKQCYVVVSELAKNTTGKKKIVVASILAAMVAGQAMQVEAAFGKITGSTGTGSLAISGAGGNYATASTDDAIAVGQDASATGRGGIAVGRKSNAVHNALSIGWIASATTQGAIAIGSALEEPGVSGQKEVVSDGFYSIAIGGASKSSGTTSVALGVKSSASEDSAIAIGTDATASKTSATAVGKSAEASGSEATSFGVASTANKDGALAIGSHSTSSVKAGTAIGYNASVSYSGAGDSWGATAIGAQTSVTGKNAVAIGRASKASGNNSLAIGAGNNDDGTASTEFAESTGTNSLAIGYNAKAKNISAVAVGKGAKAEGVASTALGETALADQDNDSALGNSVHASGGGSSAVGYLVTTSGNQAFGAGSNTTVSGGAAIGIGYMNTASGNRAISIGSDNNGTKNTASGDYSIALGAASQATKTNSTAVGTNSNATGADSFAGASGKASGDASIAIGKAANAGGTTAAASSIAIGDNAAASGVASTAVGKKALADKDNDSSFGNTSHASGGGSSAIGYLVTTSGNQAFGAGSNTTVSGTAAVGIGYSNEVTGDRAVAIGSSLNSVKTGASGDYGVAIGAASRALAEAATAIGKNTISSGADSIAIGTAATSTSAASSAISVGKNAKTEDQNAVAIGVDSYAKTMDSIAIGNTAKATGAVSTALGARAEALGTSAVAVGINAKAKKDQATALGFSAQANEKNSVALGYSAISSQENAVALGSASTTTTNATSQGSVVIGGKTITWSGAPTVTGTGMQVSVGSVGAERQIKNVAAGEVSKTSTDAINGSQLYAVADALRTKYVSIKSSATGIGSNENNDGATDTDAIAIGPKASATKPNATALGKGAAATDSNSTAIGTGAQATGSSSVALGDSANASSSQAIAIGKSTVASQYDAVAIGNGSNATASYTLATNGGAASGLMSISVGHSTEATKENAVAVGYNSKANGESSVAISGGTTEAEKAIAIGTDAQATKEGSIAQGWKSLASSKGTVAIGGSADGTELGAQATELYASAYGNQATASGQYSTALGNQSTASQSHATAVGHLANATADSAAAIGYNARAQGTYAFAAVGGQAIGVDTIAIGRDSVANTIGSIAQGKGANALGGSSIAIGSAYGTNAGAATNGENAIALGAGSSSTANNALALGLNANSSATDSIAIGAGSQTSVEKGVALGAGSKANVVSGVAGYNANTENIARTDKYSGLTGVALNSNLGALSVGVTDASGAATSTRQIVGVAAGKADTDAVNVAQLKSVNLAFTGNSGSGDVNLSKSQLAVEGGTNSFITTTAANKKLEINTTQGKLKNTSGTVSVDGNNGLAVAQNVADVINQVSADQSIKYKANGTGTNSVKLSDGLNFKDGTTTTATVGANGQVTFDLNTATQKSITDSATAVARTISLGGDTGTTTAKSLTSGNVNFGVKSGSPTYLTTTANGNDVTLTINEQAIKNAAKDASSFKVKANATAAEDVKGGDTVVFNNGDNIAITQTGKTFKIATAKNVAFDTATIGTNTTIGSTGVSTNKVTVGNISIDGTDGINAGGKAITNVGTGRVSNSSTDDGNVANIGDVKAITNNAVANLSTSLGVTDGTNSGTVNLKNQSLKVVGTGVAKATVNGQTITVDVAKGTLTNNTTTGALTGTAGVVDANDMATAVNTAITKAVDTATGTQKLDISAGGTDSSVNLKNQKLTVAGTGAATASLTGQTITVNVAEGTLTPNTTNGTATATAGVAKAVDVAAAINNTNSVLGNKITAATQSLSTLGDNKFKLTADSTSTTGQAFNQSGGLSFKVAGDGTFISTSAAGDTVTISVKQGVFGSNADGTAKSTTNGVATTDKVADIVNTTVSNAVNNITSNQNLKIGGDTTAANSAVNLKNDTLSVKGDNKYISTAASGNDITLTVNEQAIKDAAKDASSFKVKANSTAAEDVKGGDTVAFNDGDNIAITQTGKIFKIATAKNVTFDAATIGGNTTIGSTGVTTNKVTVGNISIDGTDGINAGNKAITHVGTGIVANSNADNSNVANIGDVKTIANDAVANLSTSLGVTDGTNNGTVNLKNQSLKVVGTGAAKATVSGQTITVDVAKGTLTANSATGALTGTAGVVDANDMASAVNTAITKAVDNATGTQALNLTDGTHTGTVKLSTQTLSVSGTNGVQATVGGQGITIGLDTATKNLISNSSTAVDNLGKNTFTLKSDSTDTTAQDLNKSGGLAFKVAGDGNFTSTSAAGDTVTVSVKQGVFGSNADGTAKSTTNGVATTDKVADIVNTTVSNAVNNVTSNQNLKIGGDTTAANSAVNLKNDTLSVKGDNKYISTAASGNDITLTVNEQAIKDAAKDASSFKVKANSTAAEDVKGGDTVAFNDGDNIAITQTGKTFKIATAKNVTFDAATIGGNTTIGSTGVTTNKVTVGGISIDGTNGINAGSKQITNVASGGTTVTNAANIGDVDTKVTTAINDLTTNLTKNTNIAYTANTATPGQTVSLKDGFNFTNGTLTTAEVAAGGVVKFNVTQGSLSTDGNGNIINTAGVATTDDVKNAVNTAINKAVTNSSTAVNTLGANTFTLKADSTDTTAQNLNKSGGLAFKVAGDGTFTSTSAAGDTVTVSVKQGVFGSNADGTAKSTTNGVATTDKVADIVNTTVSNAVNNVTSNQNLKIGGDTTAANSAVNLKNDTLSVKGDNKYISTAASGNDITLTVNEQAIKDAAKDASSFKVKANSTAAEDVKGGDTVAFNDGDNIAITQTGKTFKIATAKNVTFDAATIGGNTTIGSTGVTTNKVTVGGISIDGTNGINAGSKQITNVASGGTTVTNAANIGDVDTKVTTAINDLTTNLTKNTTIAYTANTATPGQTVSLKDGFNFTNGTLTTAEVAAGGVVKFNVTQGSLSTDANGNITNTAGVATTDDVKNAVNTAINKAVTNSSAAVNTLGTNTFTLTGDNSTSTTGQALNKNGGLSFKVAGDGTFITTSAATDTVTVSIKQGTFGSNTDGTAKSTTNGVATTNDVANIVNTTVNNAVTKATGAQVLNITDGNNNGSINLKNDALKVVGTDGVTTEVNGKTITVGLDTTTKDKINNASVATNKNISLAADTGTTSSQSLKDGDVSFAVKGASGDYISTNMNGSTVEISTKRATIDSNAATGQASVTGNDGLATAKNVADAINAATAKAVSQSAWKLAADGTTGTETISGGDTVNFKAGSNMEVSRTGKDITYKTKDNVAFTTVTAGTGANEVKLDGNTGTVTAKDITATGDVTAKNVTTSGNVTAAGTVKGDTVQGNTVKAGNVTITGGTTNTITGLSNTTWTPAGGIQADRAATEGQLQQAINQVNATVGSTALTFKGDTNPAQSMTLQGNTFAITGDTMIKTTTNTNGIGLSLDTSKVNIAYTANGLNGQTTSLASGFNFTDGDHTKATVAASGVVKYDAKTSTISVANGHATSSGNDLATADNVADAINQMTQNNSGNTTQLRQEISKVATETQRVGAHAAAMAALKPIQYDPLAPTQIMAGVGNYRGESAAALGIAHYTNDNTMFNVGVSVGGNHNMINAGVTHKFGISAEKKNIPDRYKAGPISSIYVMQDEMTQLRSENEAYKAKLDKQQSEIDALKAAVDQLLASKA